MTVMKRMGLPWPVRSVIAGAAGTTAMTLTYTTAHRLRLEVRGSLDYDDSLIPGKIVASVLRLGDISERGDAELGAALNGDMGRPSVCGTGPCGGSSPTRGPAWYSARPS